MSDVLFVPDLGRLRRKLAAPPPLLARLVRRFNDRLAADAAFRRLHIFLPALLGEAAALAEAKAIIMEESCDPLRLAGKQSPASATSAQDSLDGHIWCVAPRALRLAAYFTWVDLHDAWAPEERRAVASGLIHFFSHYVIPVLRSRVPAGHNQQLSMTFCCAAAGHALADVSEVAEQARALRDYALPKLRQTLGLMPASGYSGEGSAYQSHVVSGLVMWIGLFLAQRGEPDVWNRTWPPNHSRLADTLRMEAALGGCGGLLPPWDQYGWSPLSNLAARTLWAGQSGQFHLLAASESAWDEESFIAWRADDRLWTILYWPEEEGSGAGVQGSGKPHQPASPLSGWSLPAVGAAIEHGPMRLRVMTVWDRCAGGLQGICRGQANPNHLMIDLAGEPITADGWDDGSQLLFSEASTKRLLDGFSETERILVAQQYGSLDAWVRNSQQGFIGASCGIVVDDFDSYFPRDGAQGRLLFEQRDPGRHTVASESAAYYRPVFDVRRVRRTISVGVSGIGWVIDDLRACSPHRFTWRGWFRRPIAQEDSLRLRLTLPSGAGMTMAWLAEGDAGAEGALALTEAPTFPATRKGLAWPEPGSRRCDLSAQGSRARFVCCLVPFAAPGLSLQRAATGGWEARWEGGSESFVMPGALDADLETEAEDPPFREQEVACDLDEPPFMLMEEPDDALLEALDKPGRAAWRRTTAAMQTLTVRGRQEAMPKIAALLQDAGQLYTVHSVAAWCLGHARYKPALEALRMMASIPEVNTALRAGWAADRLQGLERPEP